MAKEIDNQMLDDLKFVRNAVATKDFVPELTFFRICDKRVTGFNGELAISSPIPIDLDIAPSAAHFMKAVNACDDTITLKMQKERLQVRSGKFRSFVPCIDVEKVPTLVPQGKKVVLNSSLVSCFKLLEPFMAIDASRPWACGVLLKGQSAFATNNIAIIEHWLGIELPLVNIPSYAIKEVIRYGKDPEYLLISDSDITFMYEGDRWMSCKLSALEWPDISRVLDIPAENPQPFPEGFFAGVDKLSRFGDELGRCFLDTDQLSTSVNDNIEGAVVECEGIVDAGCYNLKLLLALKGVATMIDFSQYPKPVTFFGDNIRGVMTGYMMQKKNKAE